jgi:hypothetical protein
MADERYGDIWMALQRAMARLLRRERDCPAGAGETHASGIRASPQPIQSALSMTTSGAGLSTA